MCRDTLLKDQRFFWIQRADFHIDPHQKGYMFRAVLQRQQETNFLSTLEAENGNCFDVNTRSLSRRCGLATALFYLSFIDDDITRNGGIDPDREEAFIA